MVPGPKGSLRESEAGAIIAGRRGSLIFQASPDRSTRARIFDLRRVGFEGRCEYLLGSRAGMHSAEDEHDAHSFHFCCRLGDDVVAACRYSPPVAGAWEADRLCKLPACLRTAADPPLQIGRVVVRPDLRGLLVTEVLLCMACRWLLGHTPFRWYFALCLPTLAQHYRHFGAEIIPGADVHLRERKGGRYQFVQGRLDGSIRAIEEHLTRHAPGGWTLPSFEVPTGSEVRAREQALPAPTA